MVKMGKCKVSSFLLELGTENWNNVGV